MLYRMQRTIFHKIIDREVPASIVHEDDTVLAFKDIRPQMPTHVLFIPKEFVESIAHCVGDKAGVPGMLVETARRFAAEQGITGYKLQFNVGEHGGQEVPYIHLHFLSTQALPEQ
jgi:histidine triad (HIT) family protein